MSSLVLTHWRNDTAIDHFRVARVPRDANRYASSTNVSREFAFAGTETVIDRLDEGRFAGARSSRDDVHTPWLKRHVPPLPGYAAEKDAGDITTGHDVRPIISTNVDGKSVVEGKSVTVRGYTGVSRS